MNYRLQVISFFLLAQSLIFCFAQEIPKDLSSLKQKAEKAYFAKDYNTAAKYYSELAFATKSASDYYNAACAYSLSKNIEEALKYLQNAIDSGYKNYINISTDTDLDNLRDDNRFKKFLQNTAKYDHLKTSPTDPAEAKIIYDDVNNFINAFGMLKSYFDTTQIIKKYYIDKGTAGLKIFIEKYGLTAAKIADKIRQYPQDYAAIKIKLNWLKSREIMIRAYFNKLKVFIPNAVYPPTYYLIGSRRGIGSGSIEGQLITIEKQAVDTVDIGIEGHVIHELTHLNQLHAIGSLKKYLAIYNDEKSLLAICIREGVAEFFAELVTGAGKKEAQNYLAKHEMEIWRRFEADMYGVDTKDWVWEEPVYPDQPQDIGYVLGAKIVEYYYKHALNLNEAVDVILSITDYKGFLKKSGYSQKFQTTP